RLGAHAGALADRPRRLLHHPVLEHHLLADLVLDEDVRVVDDPPAGRAEQPLEVAGRQPVAVGEVALGGPGRAGWGRLHSGSPAAGAMTARLGRLSNRTMVTPPDSRKAFQPFTTMA